MLNLSNTPPKLHKAGLPSALSLPCRGIYSDLRNHRKAGRQLHNGRQRSSSSKHGGATGYRDMYDTLNDRAKDLQDELENEHGAKARRLATLVSQSGIRLVVRL